MPVSALDAVADSYKRCLGDAAFFDRFYARLFARRPDVEAMFARVDLEAQRTLMRKALSMILLLSVGSPTGTATLKRVRASHGPDGLAVTDGQYRAWVDCLVETAAETDPRFDADLAKGWRRVLEAGVAYLRG